MIGTVINIITVAIGSTLGIFFGARLPERMRTTVVAGLGLFTAAYGIKTFLVTQNSIIALGSLLVGGVLGEWWRIEDGLNNLGGWLEERFIGSRNKLEEASATQTESSSRERFMQGFLTASLVFCIGPLTILGSIKDGLTGDYSDLAIKSVLDGFASLAFASTMGIGVLFSVLTILVVQGGISLLAAQAKAIISTAMMNEMTAVGGLLLVGLSISSLLEIKKIRVGNFLPALVLAPIIVAILEYLGISF